MKSTIDTMKEVLEDKLGADPDTISRESTFTELGADSLDTVELIMEFETKFDVSIPDDDAYKMQNVGQFEDYINQKLGNK